MNENIPPIDVADDDRQAMSDLEVLGVRAKWKPTWICVVLKLRYRRFGPLRTEVGEETDFLLNPRGVPEFVRELQRALDDRSRV